MVRHVSLSNCAATQMHVAAKCSSESFSEWNNAEMHSRRSSQKSQLGIPVSISHCLRDIHWQQAARRFICKKPFCSASHLFFFGYSNVSCWAWLRPCVSSGQGWFMGPVLGAAGFVPVTPEGASLSVLYPVIGYTSGGTPVTQLSKLQIELTNRINP